MAALGAGRLGERLAAKPGAAIWQDRIAGTIMIVPGAWLLVSR
jgi:threonine/homoserine/homoserine lactone efflux protein